MRERVDSEVRSALTGMGFDEACTFSLTESADWDPFPGEDGVPPLKVDHSTRKREVYLRKAIAPSLLKVRGHNEAHGNADVALFEIAHVYRPKPKALLPDEPTRLALVSSRDFLGAKGAVIALMNRLHMSGNLDVQPSAHRLLVVGRQADLVLEGVRFGTIGEVDSAMFDEFGLRSPTSIVELDFGLILNRATLIPQYRPLPQFPGVERDLSIVVDQTLPWSEIASAARSVAGQTLESLAFFDTFAGGNVPEGKHSLHFGLAFRHSERTLTGEEVDRSVQAVVASLAARFGAELRS